MKQSTKLLELQHEIFSPHHHNHCFSFFILSVRNWNLGFISVVIWDGKKRSRRVWATRHFSFNIQCMAAAAVAFIEIYSNWRRASLSCLVSPLFFLRVVISLSLFFSHPWKWVDKSEKWVKEAKGTKENVHNFMLILLFRWRFLSMLLLSTSSTPAKNSPLSQDNQFRLIVLISLFYQQYASWMCQKVVNISSREKKRLRQTVWLVKQFNFSPKITPNTVGSSKETETHRERERVRKSNPNHINRSFTLCLSPIFSLFFYVVVVVAHFLLAACCVCCFCLRQRTWYNHESRKSLTDNRIRLYYRSNPYHMSTICRCFSFTDAAIGISHKHKSSQHCNFYLLTRRLSHKQTFPPTESYAQQSREENLHKILWSFLFFISSFRDVFLLFALNHRKSFFFLSTSSRAHNCELNCSNARMQMKKPALSLSYEFAFGVESIRS